MYVLAHTKYQKNARWIHKSYNFPSILKLLILYWSSVWFSTTFWKKNALKKPSGLNYLHIISYVLLSYMLLSYLHTKNTQILKRQLNEFLHMYTPMKPQPRSKKRTFQLPQKVPSCCFSVNTCSASENPYSDFCHHRLVLLVLEFCTFCVCLLSLNKCCEIHSCCHVCQ